MQPSPPAPTPPPAPPIPRQTPWTHIGLLGILLLAAALRLAGLSHVAPPGLNQDEAVNGWNAWCLLKTGQDQAGVRWPIFYTQALGENRTTLFLYTLLPFQLIGGLSVLTTRLPSAVGGVLTVLLLYWIAARLFNRPTGLIAALLLALNPWHIQLSRLGHEAAICPLLACAALADYCGARTEEITKRRTHLVIGRSRLGERKREQDPQTPLRGSARPQKQADGSHQPP